MPYDWNALKSMKAHAYGQEIPVSDLLEALTTEEMQNVFDELYADALQLGVLPDARLDELKKIFEEMKKETTNESK